MKWLKSMAYFFFRCNGSQISALPRGSCSLAAGVVPWQGWEEVRSGEVVTPHDFDNEITPLPLARMPRCAARRRQCLDLAVDLDARRHITNGFKASLRLLDLAKKLHLILHRLVHVYCVVECANGCCVRVGRNDVASPLDNAAALVEQLAQRQ